MRGKFTFPKKGYYMKSIWSDTFKNLILYKPEGMIKRRK